MIWLLVFGWWAIGFSTCCWLYGKDEITWGQLALCVLLGFLGLLIFALVAYIVIADMDFWNKRIFRK